LKPSPAATSSISGRLAVSVLEWLIGSNHLGANGDLCLVRTLPGLDDDPMPEEVVLSTGRRWKLAFIDGEFDLRMKLVEAGTTPLVAFTPCDEVMFSADLRERTALRYVIRPLARHTFAALIGADASALDDERFSQALRDVFDGSRRAQLLAAIRRRTWGNVVRESDATAILSEAAFGFDDRFVESRPGELLARWLEAPPLLTPSLFGIAIEILRRRYPLYADLLENTPDRSPETAFRLAARHDQTHDRTYVQLARDAGRILRTVAPARLDDLLREAEGAYVAAGSPKIRALLLRTAAQSEVRALVHRSASDAAPSTDDIAVLSDYLYYEPKLRDALILLARLGRGLFALERMQAPTEITEDAHVFRHHIAWLDRAARRLREIHFDDGASDAVAGGLVGRYYALRDTWNLAFATRAKSTWPTLFAKPGERQPFVVSHLLKHVVRPKLIEGTHVFLVVLDGCDVPTFLEITEALGVVGVPVPTVDVILSAVPTLTSHARRAIFSGKIPKDSGGSGLAIDPNGDHKAFEGPNSFLDGFTRKLYLKGELGDDGKALVVALKEKTEQLIGAVFNDVDDAIASKEQGVLPERTIERCTKAFRDAMITANDNGWQIVLTADHGHTPYRAPDVKLTLEHPRYAELSAKERAPANTVVFEIGIGAPYRIAAAYQMGAHSGPQRVGYHGGVSLEEMFVPLAIYGSQSASENVLVPPSWWDGVAVADRAEAQKLEPVAPSNGPGVVVLPPLLPSPVAPARLVIQLPVSMPSLSVPPPPATPQLPLVADVNGTGYEIGQRCRATLVGEVLLLAIFNRIAEAKTLDAAQLARAVSLPPGRIRQYVVGLRDKLEEAEIEPPFTIDDDPLVVRWIGPR
jgi:PglZ domain